MPLFQARLSHPVPLRRKQYGDASRARNILSIHC
jgi:hypothetical protein